MFHSPVIAKSLGPAASAKRAVPDSCATQITPTCLQDLYGIPTANATVSNGLAVSGFSDNFANDADLEVNRFESRSFFEEH